jgi:predicted nucleic acid-binding protein
VTLVFNASPLIVLAKAGLLERMMQVGDSVVIPQAVVDEVCRIDNPADPARVWLEGRAASFPCPPAPALSSFLAAWDLGAGETAVIALAEATPQAIAVLDDLAARRCARALGIAVVGTLGLVLLAKRKGLIPAVAEPLAAITAAGLFISSRHLAAIRLQAGE